MILLASNENPLGMPESARRAAAEALAGAGNYPDNNGTALKNALAARLDVPADWLTLGSGSSEILELAAQVSLKPGGQRVLQRRAVAVGVVARALERGGSGATGRFGHAEGVFVGGQQNHGTGRDLFKKLNISGTCNALISAYPLHHRAPDIDYLHFCHG